MAAPNDDRPPRHDRDGVSTLTPISAEPARLRSRDGDVAMATHGQRQSRSRIQEEKNRKDMKFRAVPVIAPYQNGFPGRWVMQRFEPTPIPYDAENLAKVDF
jgi:hypothetical protein